jgi:hypothetical protein
MVSVVEQQNFDPGVLVPSSTRESYPCTVLVYGFGNVPIRRDSGSAYRPRRRSGMFHRNFQVAQIPSLDLRASTLAHFFQFANNGFFVVPTLQS